MNLFKKNLILNFGICLLLFLTMPLYFPSLRLFFFAPFLIFLCYKKPFLFCLWGAFLCGLIIDLLSSRNQFGIFTLSYVLSLALLYEQRQNFFGDSLSTLPLMVFFFSLLATLIQSLAIYILEKENIFSWGWFFHDLIGMSLGDAFYAFALFIFPFLLFGKKPKKGKEYFAS